MQTSPAKKRTNVKSAAHKTKRLLPKALCLSLACIFAAPAPADDLNLPDIGTAAAGTLSIAQERQYGEAYIRILRSKLPMLGDPVMNSYINQLGHKLSANARDVRTPFNFFLVRDAQINAFAFFGGHVVANTGLFLYAANESELASVLAHEIAHVTQRHLARRMESEARRSPLTIAAMIGSVLLAIASPEAGIAALNASTAGSIQAGINYTRSNEEEADRFGIETLARSGFNPKAMPNFFGHLADQYRYASTPPPLLLTHPLPQSRVTDSRERAQNYPSVSPPQSLDFWLAKARVIARYSNYQSISANAKFDRIAKTGTSIEKKASTYGKVLVAIDDRKWSQANSLLQGLLKTDASNPFYLDALADLYIGQKRYNQAISALKKGLTANPNNPAIIINLANVYIESGQPKSAISMLQRYTHQNPDDPTAWQLLATANRKSGNKMEQLASQGEVFALYANWNKAIDAYSEASSMAKYGSLEQARYDARIDQLRYQREMFASLDGLN
ncbi:MAG: M48 family metalloprotease [Vibrio sp.]